MTFWKNKNIGTEITSVVTSDWGWGKGINYKKTQATCLDDGNILYLDRGSGYTVPFVRRH